LIVYPKKERFLLLINPSNQKDVTVDLQYRTFTILRYMIALVYNRYPIVTRVLAYLHDFLSILIEETSIWNKLFRLLASWGHNFEVRSNFNLLLSLIFSRYTFHDRLESLVKSFCPHNFPIILVILSSHNVFLTLD